MIEPSLTALIIAKNEAHMLPGCLQTLKWCTEVIVVDDGSTDATAQIAEKWGAKVISFKHRSFSRLREEALKRADTDWVMYIDADERVVPTLAKEIMVHLETGESAVLSFPRANFFYGVKFEYGGWGTERLTRVFKRSALKGWSGIIHESPEYEGTVQELKTPLVHLSHRDTASGLRKSADWTAMEAELLFKAGVARVTFWTILRKGSMEFFRRVILQRGFKDGSEGVMEGVIQALNRVLVYIQVWELQQEPPIQDRYQQVESDIEKLWKRES